MAYDGVYRIECDIPEIMVNPQAEAPKSLSIQLRYDALFFTEEHKEQLAELVQQYGNSFEWPSIPDGRVAQQTQDIDLSTIHVANTKYSLCLVPFWGYDKYVGNKRPLRFIEWRLYWQKLGVER